MPYIEEVQCTLCANNGADCEDCVHNYEDYEDLFYELSEEEIREREYQVFKEAKEALAGEKLIMPVPREFVQAFAAAQKFSTQELRSHAKYWDVFCGEDYLMATDGHALAKIQTAVPEALRGKHLVDCTEDGVTMSKQPSAVFGGEAQGILNEVRNDSYPAERVLTKEELKDCFCKYESPDGSEFLQIQDGPVIQEILLDRVMAALEDGETVSLRYHPRLAYKQLGIEGKSIECFIMPVLTDEEKIG
ncbi:hypothetical protein CEB3_c13590 [Peptococcaceae bacterium CEB3]|nr:hypothetical protein CEB3_c13590 [Peptococcaceae bacterium CEB3]